MKKIYLAAGLCLSLFACEDEQVTPEISNENNVATYTIQNGILSFSSEDSYELLLANQDIKFRESFIESLKKNNSYVSLSKRAEVSKANPSGRALSQAEEEAAETNEFLGHLLNEDGMVAIGDRLYRVDLSKELVYAGHKDSVTVEELKAGTSKNKALLAFSTNDDVLDLINAGVRGTVNEGARMAGSAGNASVLGLFCSEDGAEGDKDDSFVYINDYYRQDNKIVYQKAGIYFSLQSKIKYQEKSLSGIWVAAPNTGLVLNAWVKYKPKCRAEQEKTEYRTLTSNELSYRPYESTRGLHKYHFRVDFHAIIWSRVYEIRKGY